MCSPGLPVCDDAVFDAVVDSGRNDTPIEEFILATIGPEADDARCPDAGEAGDLDESVEGSCVDINRL